MANPSDFTGNQYWQPGQSVDYPKAKPKQTLDTDGVMQATTGIQAKARQGISLEPTDSAHTTTHRAPGSD